MAEEDTFATWAGGDVVGTTVIEGQERPVIQMSYPVYAESVSRLRDRLRDLRLGVAFDWSGWDGLNRYLEDHAALAVAPVGDAVRVLIGIERSERFIDGNIETALTSGLMQAALARLRRWYDVERTVGPPSAG